MTKINEEWSGGTLLELCSKWESVHEVRGECVLVLEPCVSAGTEDRREAMGEVQLVETLLMVYIRTYIIYICIYIYIYTMYIYQCIMNIQEDVPLSKAVRIVLRTYPKSKKSAVYQLALEVKDKLGR